MITLKIEENKRKHVILKMKIAEKDKSNLFIKRVLYESEEIKSGKTYEYKVPMRYFLPLYKNLSKTSVKIHKNSITSFYEFSDEYDEDFYYSQKATAKFMKTWRAVGCPNVYKISLNISEKSFDKRVVFKKPRVDIDRIY
ncbi:hypothetical protein ACFIJ5_14635 [Haloimpatiens sp. FM7330]|uniref:hypothetical protein n=1 Tax=Haloimpatiens sp. FM7330 TaxID=3298610 RepID=UPI003632337D